MAQVNISSLDDVRVFGFDLHLKTETGEVQIIKDALIDIAKGTLEVMQGDKVISMQELVKSTKVNLESLENVFLENVLSSEQSAPFEEENEVQQELEEQKELQEQRQQELEAELERLEELKEQLEEAEQELAEKEKELLDKEQEEIVDESEAPKPDGPSDAEDFVIEVQEQVTDVEVSEFEFEGESENPDKKVQLVPEAQPIAPTGSSSSSSRPTQDGEQEEEPEEIIQVTLTLDKGDDSGKSGDFVTNVTTDLTFNGVTTAGAAVTLVINSSTYIVTADSTGAFKVDVDESFVDGEFDIQVTAVSPTGSEATINKTLTIDTTPPEAPTVSLAAESDLGVSNNDKLTSDDTPTFNGEAEAFATIQLTIDGRTYETQADKEGNWSLTATTKVADGVQQFEVIAIDAAGNKSDKTTDNVEIDTTLLLTGSLKQTDDIDTGYSQTDAITKHKSPEFTGKVDADATVKFYFNGSTSALEVDVASDGSWTLDSSHQLYDDFLANLDDGTYQYKIVAEDAAGNVKEIENQFVIDSVAPTQDSWQLDASSDTGRSDSDQYTNKQNPYISGVTEANSFISVEINGNTYTTQADASGNWAVRVDDALPHGEYEYQVSATDYAGNTSNETGQLTIDLTPPSPFSGDMVENSLVDTGLNDSDKITKNTMPTFAGVAELDAIVELVIDGKTFQTTVDTSGNWTITVDQPLSQGTHNYHLNAYDLAGNKTAIIDQSITIDTEVVTFTGGLDAEFDTGISNTDNLTKFNQPTFSGTGEEGATVYLTLNTSPETTLEATVVNGVWSISLADHNVELEDRTYDYSLKTVDLAGNDASLPTAQIQVDTLPPQLFKGGLENVSDTGTSDDDNYTSDNLPTFSGEVEPGSHVTLLIGGVEYDANVDASGIWSVTVTEQLADGDQAYTLTAKDDAGNPVVKQGSITIDTEVNLQGGLDASSDTGRFDNDDYTRDTTPTFSGTAEEGSTVTVTIDGKEYSVEVADNGDGVIDTDVEWSIDVTNKLKNDGSYDYTITTQDKAGNTNQFDPIEGQIELDTLTEVTAALSSATKTGWDDTHTNLTKPEFVGTGEVDAIITITLTKGEGSDRETKVYTTKVAENGTWFKQVEDDLGDGEWSYQVVAQDLAGVADSESGVVTVDTQDPVFSGGVAASSDTNITTDGITQTRLPKFSGKGEVGHKVELSLNGQTYTTTVDPDGNWTIELTNTNEFEDGEYPYTIVATDGAGNTTPINSTLVVDNEASVTGSLANEDDTGAYDSDGITQTRNPTFAGKGDVGATVTLSLGNGIGDITTTVDQEGNWSIDLAQEGVSLQDNLYSYQITLVDIAGNKAKYEGQLEVDNQVPGKLTGGLDADSDKGDLDGYTNIRDPWFSGETDPQATVTLLIDGKEYSAEVDPLGGWRVQITDELANGTYTYVLTAEDLAGNKLVKSDSVTIDTVLESYTHGLSSDPLLGDSGVSGDNLTKHVQPTLSGTAEKDAKIVITINNQVYTTQADDNGNWSLKVTQNLLDPNSDESVSFDYTIDVTDKAGNHDSDTGKITVDPKTEVSGDLASSDDTGVPYAGEEGTYSDNYTSETKPKFEGNGELGATVTLSIGGKTYSTIVLDSGIWQIQVTEALANDGEVVNHDFTINAEDAAGNTAATSGSITVDAQHPTGFTGKLSAEDDYRDDGVADAKDSDDITSVQSPTFAGTLTRASEQDPHFVTLTIAGQDYTIKVTDSDWQITVPTTLPDGTYNYTLKAVDKAGNVTTLEQEQLVIDTTTEAINGGLSSSDDVGDSSSDGITSYAKLGKDELKFNGTAEANAEIQLLIGDDIYKSVADSDGNWELIVTERIDEGKDIEYTLKSIDLAGNIQTDSGKLTIDNTPADVVVNMPALTNEIRPDISGTVTEDVATIEVTIDGISYILNNIEAGNWQIDGDALFGNKFLSNNDAINYDGIKIDYKAVATDVAGNESDVVSGSFIFDNKTHVSGELKAGEDTAPNLIVDGEKFGSNSDNYTSKEQPTFSGMAESGATVTLYFSNQTVTAVVESDGSWTAVLTKPLPEGNNTYTIKAVDEAGNEATLSQTVTIDTTKPTVALDQLSDVLMDGVPAVADKTPTFSGTGEPGTAVIVSISGQTRSVLVDDQGRWSVTMPNDIAHSETPYAYQVYSVDKAGNQSDTLSGELKIDVETSVSGGLSALSDTGFENDDGITKDNTPTFNGRGEAGATVTVTIYASDGLTVVKSKSHTITSTGNPEGNWSITIPGLDDNAADDNYLYQVSITDALGNDMKLEQESLVIDTTAPDDLSIDLADGYDSGYELAGESDLVTNKTPVFEGTVEPGGKVTFSIKGEKSFDIYDLDGDGKWSTNDFDGLDLGDYVVLQGSYEFSVTATDKAGNVTSKPQTITIVYDKVSDLELTQGLQNDLEVTNNQTPTFSGVAEHKSQIKIDIAGYDKDGKWQEFQVEPFVVNDESGAWSFTLPESMKLPESKELPGYTYKITAVDYADNQTSVSGHIYVDTTPPTVTGGLDDGSDSGEKDGILTNEQSPIFSGTVEPGATVKVVIDNQTYHAIVNDDGSWKAEPGITFDNDVNLDYEIIATDEAGNTTKLDKTLEIDTSKPVITGGDLAEESDSGIKDDQLTNEEGLLVFQGTASDKNFSELVFKIEGVDYSDYLEINGNNWTVSIPNALGKFSDGSYSYTIEAKDEAGNSSGVIAKEFSIDRTDPNDPEIETKSLTNDKTPEFIITADADTSITLHINGIEINSDDLIQNDDGTWSWQQSSELSSGVEGDWDGVEHSYKVVSTDAAGNSSEAEGSFVVDTQTFVAGGLSLVDQTGTQKGATSKKEFSFSGTAEQGSQVKIVFASTGNADLDAKLKALIGDDLTLDGVLDAGTSNWSADLAGFDFEGEFNYIIQATDEAGNLVSTEEQTLVVDRTPPLGLAVNLAAESDSNIDGDNITNLQESGTSQAPRFEGTSEAGSTVTLVITSNDGTYRDEYQVDVEDGTWLIETNTVLADGNYTVEVSAIDSVGNVTTLDELDHKIGLTVDTAISVTAGLDTASDSGVEFDASSNSDTITNVKQPIISGTGDEGDTITLDINGAQYQTTVINGKWSVDLSSDAPTSGALADLVHGETYFYTVEAKDLAGNTTTLGAGQGSNYSITIDDTAFINGGLEHDSDSDTGMSAQDGITNADLPVFSGSVEPDSQVKITFKDQNDNTTVVSASVSSDDSQYGASWTYQPDRQLLEGEYTYVVEVTDKAGNNTQLPEQNLVVDRTLAEPTAGLEQTKENNTGASQTDSVTQVRNPILVGKTEADAIVTIKFDGFENSYASFKANSDGDWKFVVPEELADGEYTYSVKVEDIAGNPIESTGNKLVIDNQDPLNLSGGLSLASDTSNGLGETKNTTLNFNGQVEAQEGMTVQLVIRLNGVIVDTIDATVSSFVDGDVVTTWVVDDVTLDANQTYEYDIIATDLAGNTSIVEKQQVTIDNIAPEVTGKLTEESDTGIVDGITYDNTPEFAGTGEEGTTVTIKFGETTLGPVTVVDGKWQIESIELADGDYGKYTIIATDKAGNKTEIESSEALVIDTQASLTGGLETTNRIDVTDQNYTSDQTPVFSGTADEGSTVYITLFDDNRAKLNISPNPIETVANLNPDNGLAEWSVEVGSQLTAGAYSYQITVKDLAGNTKDSDDNELVINSDFTVDPSTHLSDIGLATDSDTGLEGDDDIAEASRSDQVTSDRTPTIVGKAEFGAKITLVINGVSYNTEVENQDGSWRIEIDKNNLEDQEYTYNVTTVDKAGNTLESGDLQFTIDTSKPDSVSNLTIHGEAFDSDGNLTNQENPVFAGKAEPHSRVYIEVEGLDVFTANVDENGDWSVKVDDIGNQLDSGIERDYTIKVVDSAGNASSAVEGKYTLDEKTTLDINAVDMSDGSNSSDKGDMLTNFNGETHLVFTGTSGSAEQGATIEYKLVKLVNGVEVEVSGYQEVVASVDGSWSAALESLSVNDTLDKDGSYKLYIKSTDLAGNNDVESLEFKVDRIDPSVADTTVDHAVTGSPLFNTENIKLTGTVEVPTDGEAEAKVRITIKGSDGWSQTYTVDSGTTADGTWDIDIDLSGRDNSNPDGVEYTYSIEAEDAAGNVNTTIKDQTLTVDTVAKLTASGNDYDDGALEITNRSDVNDQNYAGKTPTFSGQSDANATIKLVLTSSTSGVLNPEPITVEANASGDWSIDLALENVSLVEGADYEYTITVTDIAGNTTNAEGDELQLTGDFTVDSTTDLVDDSIKLDQASDTGLTDNDKQATLSDQKTSLNTPTIEGKAEVGSIVTVTIEGDSNSPYTLDPITNADGYWSVTTKELASGTYNYTVSTVDRAGNTDSETSSFTIDSDAPAPVEVTKISEQLLGDLAFVDDHYITGEANPVFSGTAEKGARVYLEFNGQTYSADADSVTGVWSIPLPDVGDASLEQGIDRSVTLYVKDDAGNKSDETQIHYTLDQKTTLDINAVDMSDGSNSSDKGDMLTNFNGETHLVFTGTSGSAEQGATIEYKLVKLVNGVEVEVSGYQEVVASVDGSWSAALESLSVNDSLDKDGSYKLYIKSTDLAGNNDVESLEFKVDRIDPSVADTTVDHAVTGSPLFNTENIKLTGTVEVPTGGEAEAKVRITIKGSDGWSQTYTVDSGTTADGTWDIDIDLSGRDNSNPDGVEYTYSIEAEDAAGNVNAIEDQTLTIDTSARLENVGLKAGEQGDTGRDSSFYKDKITSAELPVFVGTAEKNAIVKLFIRDGDGNYVQSGDDFKVESDDGSFSLQLADVDKLTNEGEFHYRIEVEDAAGHKEQFSDSFTYDNSVSKAEVTLTDDSDSGESNSDAITNVLTPSFNVDVEENSKVTFKLYKGDQLLVESEQVVRSGQFTTSFPDLKLNPDNQGSDYRYEIIAVDPAGNSKTDSGSLVVDIYVDLTDVKLANVTGDRHEAAGDSAIEITSANVAQFSGKAEGGAKVDIYIKVDGEFVKVANKKLDGDQSQLNQSWQLTVGEGDGLTAFAPVQGASYEYKVVVTDIAGNTDEATGEYVFDNATTVTADLDSTTDLGADNDDNLTNTNGDNNPIISGKAEAGSVITITVTHNGVEYDYELTLPYPTADQIDTQVDWEIDLSDGNLLKPTGTAPTFIEGEYSYVVNSTDIAGNSDSSTGSFTVDNSAPTVSGGFTTGDSTNDTGFADDDGITNNNQPTFSGEYSGINAAIAGSDESVEIYLTIDGRTFKASASNGDWEIDLSQPLQEVIGFGTNSQSVISRDNVTLTDQVDKPYTITAVDAAGNVTELNDGKVTIDTETSIIADLAASSDLGPNNDDNKTSVIAPVIEGSDAEPGSRIYIEFDRGTVLRFPNAAGDGIELHDGKYYVIADEDGNWSITADGLISEANDTFSDIYQYKVTVTDIAGNTAVYDSNADNNNLDIKFKDPALDDSDGLKSDTENDTGLNQSDGITNNLTPDFTGQIATPDDAQFTVTVTFYKDGVVYKQFDSDTEGSVVITDNGTNLGSWTLSDVALPEGKYTYKVEASNDYGNKDSFEKTLVIDDTAPSLSIADVTLDLGSDSSMDLAVSGTDLGFGSDDKTSVTKPQFNIDLNESDAAVEFFILDENDNLIQSYSSTDNEITWNSSENRWELTSDNINLLAQGNYQYYVKATDVAGNATITDKSVFEIDTQVVVEGQLAAESDSGSSSDDGYTNNDALKFSGTVTDNDAGSRVKVTLYPGDNGQEQSLIVTVNDDGSWEVSFDSLGLTGVSDVPYKIEAWDIEGNHSEISGDDVKVVVDKVLPNMVTEVTMPATWGDNDAVNDTGDVGDWKTKENDPVISGKAEHEATVVITVHKLLLDEDGKPILDGEGKPQIDPDFDAETYTKYTTADSDEWHFQFGEGANSIMDADSTYQFTVDVYDKAGNKNEESFVQQVTNDSTINLTVQLAEEDKVDQQSSVDGSLTESDINPTDNIIRVATPTIEGTTDLDVNQISVELSNGESTVYTGLEVTKNADGTWFLDLSDANHGIDQLADGHWTVTVMAEDTAGNQTTQNFEFEIDTTAPVEPTVELNSGVDHYDGITGLDLVSDTTPNFKGTAEEGSQIKLFIEDSKGNVFEYSAVDLVGSDGQWRMTVGNENWFGDDGKYNYYVTSTDKVGNISTSAEGEFRIDTTPPEISDITLVSSGDANGLDLTDDKWLTNAVKDELTITGKIDPSEIYGGVINLYIDGKSTAAISLNIEDVLDQNSNGDFSFVLGDLSKSLTEGNHEIKIVAIDKAGNESDAFETVLEIDRSVELDAKFTSDTANPEDGWTFNPQPEFTGTSDENAVITVTIFDKDGNEVWKESTNATEQGNWTITATNPTNKDPNNPIPFPDGKYSYVISAVDHLGNATTDSDKVKGDFFVDTEAPAFNDDLQKLFVTEDGETVARNFVLGEDQEIITSDRTLTFTGQSEALNLHGETIQATISIYVGSMSADNLLKSELVNVSNGTYSITTDEMPYGVHDIFLVSTDKAGNETVIQEQITIRPNELPVTVYLDDESNSSKLEDTLTNITNPKLHGEATPYSTVTVSIKVNGETITFTTQAAIDGKWEVQLGAGDLGSHSSGNGSDFKPIDGSVSHDDLIDGKYYLPDGTYDIDVSVSKDGIDLTGEYKSASLDGGLVIDSVNTLSDVHVQGGEGGLTNSETMNILGKTDPGAHVTVVICKKGEPYDATGTNVRTSFAGSNGEFSVSTRDLEDGVEYTYWVTSIDSAGNLAGYNPESQESSQEGSTGNIIIDRVKPEIDGGVVTDGDGFTPGPEGAEETAHYITRDDTPTFSGTLFGDFKDAYIKLNGQKDFFYIAKDGAIASPVEGGVISLVKRNDDSDIWDWKYTLPHHADGTYNFELITNDEAGNDDMYKGVVRVKTAINFQVSLDSDSADETDFITNQLDTVDGEGGYVTFNCATEADNTVTATFYGPNGEVLAREVIKVDQTNSAKIAFQLPAESGDFQEGTYKVVFTVTDEAGNTLSTENQEISREVTYDKTPPPITVGLDTASDTGDIEAFGETVSTDNKTMLSKPVFAGTGEANADVLIKIYKTVWDNQSQSYVKTSLVVEAETRVSDKGSWSYSPKEGTLLDGVADGTFVVEVSSTDIAGNKSGDEPVSMDLTIRTSEPEIGTWKILAKTDKDNTVEQTGVDENGNPIYVVNDANDAKEIYFQGEGATAGDTIRITIHGVEYKTIVEQDGTWSITTDPMPDLEYPFMIQALDDVGHVVTENSTVIFDSGITLTADFIEEDGWYWTHNTSNPNPEVKIYTEKDNLIEITITGPDGYTHTETFYAESTAFTYVRDEGHIYADGSYEMTIKASDKAGNTADDRVVKFTVDTKLDKMPDPEISIYENGVVSFHGKSDDKYEDTDLNIYYTNDPNFTVRVDKDSLGGEGIRAFYVKIFDLDGKEIKTYGTDEIKNGDVFEIKLRDLLTHTDGVASEYKIELVYKDKAGNTPTDDAGNDIKTEFIVSVNEKTTATGTHLTTEFVVTDLDTGVTYTEDNKVHIGQSKPVISGFGAEVGAQVTIIISGNGLNPSIIETVEVTDDGTWTFNPDRTFDDGLYEIDVIIKDKWGNDTHYEEDMLIDTFAPVIAMDKVEGDIDYLTDDVLWNTDSGKLSGVLTDRDASLTIQIGDGDAIDVTVDSNGRWEFNFTDELVDGETVDVKLTATDEAGNSSDKEFELTYDSREQMPFINDELTRSTDTGESSSDGVTNEALPTFEGRAEPNSEIILEIAGEKISTQVDSYGEWKIDLSKELGESGELLTLAEGDNDYTLTESQNGEVTRNDSGTIHLDTQAPSIIPDSIDYSDTTLSGLATEDGDIVEIFDQQGNELGEATVADGSWSVSDITGGQTVDIVISDVAGNETKVDDFTI